MVMMVIIALAGVISVLILIKIFWKSAGTLPGPMALPIIGHLHLIGGSSLHILLRDMSTKYGDVFRLKLGSKETVIVSTKKAIQEAFVKQAKTFAARPDLPTFKWTMNGQTGLSLCSYTEEYKLNKSIAMGALHNFCANTTYFDKLIEGEVSKMNKLFDSYAGTGKCFYPFDEFRKIVPSLFISLLFGESQEYDDPELLRVAEAYKLWFDVAEADNPADFFPFMLYFPNKRLEIAKDCSAKFDAFTMSMIDQYSKVSTGEDYDEDKLSLFDTLVLQYTNKNKAPLSHVEKQRLAKMLSDMVGGGFDTGASTLSWAMLYLLQQKEILQKCREEIGKVVAKEGNLSITSKSQLTYTSATLYDIFRLSSVAPLGLAHEAGKDTTLMGYKIPKGTMVMPNLWQMNHDPDRWEIPELLYPEHFLTEEGAIDNNAVRELMTFSTGVRACPGKNISFSMSLVILATLINRYDFSIVQEPEDLIPERGLTLKPKPYSMRFSRITE